MHEITHNQAQLEWIKRQMNLIGVKEFRFCIENDCYVCDKQGHFFSVCARLFRNGKRQDRYKIVQLNGSIDKYGYITYRVVVDGRKRNLKGHRMMLNAWEGRKDDLVVNHIDGNKRNNALENLEWCTIAENNHHAIQTGLFNPKFQKGRLKKIDSSLWVTIYILYTHCGYSYSKLGRMNGCTHDTIKRVVDKVASILPKEVKGNA